MSEEISEQASISKKKRFPVWIIIATIIVIIGGTVGGIAIARSILPQRRAIKQLELARKYVSELNYEQAIIAYKAAIKIDPKNADAYLELADVYLQTGDEDQARNVLERAAKKVDKADRDRIDDKLDELPVQTALSPDDKGSTGKTGEKNEGNKQGDSGERSDSGDGETNDESSQNDKYEPYWSNADNEVHEYNENGYVVKTTAYRPDGSIDHYIIYDCDEHGKLLTKTDYSGDGSIYSKVVYNSAGVSIRTESFWEDGSGHICEYNDERQILKQTYYTVGGQICEYYLYEHFENGNWTTASFKADGSKKAFEELDARGRSVVHIVYNDDGSEDVHWEYEYLDNGNEKQSVYENGRIVQINEYNSAGYLVNSTDY